VLAVHGADVGGGDERRHGAQRLDGFDRGGGDHHISGVQRAAVAEALAAVHDHGEVKPEARILLRQRVGLHADHERERRRRDHIAVARRPRGLAIAAQLAALADSVGEIRDLYPADLVGLGRPENPADVLPVEGHLARLPLAGLAVRAVAAAVRTVLLELEAVRVVTPVLLRDVVAVLALLASQRDLRPDIGGSHGGVPFYKRSWSANQGYRMDKAERGSANTPTVAEAGLEPATQRL
jgi:hypothetical protein